VKKNDKKWAHKKKVKFFGGGLCTPQNPVGIPIKKGYPHSPIFFFGGGGGGERVREGVLKIHPNFN
jgi:hypothetical protein